MIRYWGYPVEEHTVITEDGYILGMHRIPFGQNGSYNDGLTRPPVFLAHGLTSSSSQWVFGPPTKALGYLLADAGYDVWMGNTRGNTYSKAHVNLDTCSRCKEFWDFGFDETGVYDYSAEIDLILEVTGFEKLRFVGHSMGGTQYMILLSERPEYNDKIQEGYLLAPAVFMTYAPHPVFIFSSLGNTIEDLVHLLGMYELVPESEFVHWLSQIMCDQVTDTLPGLCDNFAFAFCGINPAQFNETMASVYLDMVPAGTSTRPIVHYAQLHMTDLAFQKFDFGSKENEATYGSSTPPAYDLSNVKTPLAIWVGDKDYLVDIQDVDHLVSVLPNVKFYETVDIPGFTHLDFATAIDSDKAVYAKIIEKMNDGL